VDQIFDPPDAEERLPRELLLKHDPAWFGVELRRFRLLGKRRIPWFLWTPAPLAILAVMILAGGDPLAASAACLLLFGFFWLVTSPQDSAT
jgi:hypothetical protein